MKRKIERSYEIHARDVREAVCAALKAKSLPVPQYIADAPDCKWQHHSDGGITLWWSEIDEVEP